MPPNGHGLPNPNCRTFAPVREIDLKARALLIRTQIIRHSGEGSLIQVIAVRAQSGLCKATETNTRFSTTMMPTSY